MLDVLIPVLLSVPRVGAYALLALGIVVIYRASRVLNLAHGAMAMFPAYVQYTLVSRGMAPVVALPLAVLSGALLGILVERVFVRRLRPQGPAAQTVGTVAVTALVIAIVSRVWGTTPIVVEQPVLPVGEVVLRNTAFRYGDIGLFVVAGVLATATFAFFRYTDYGLAMRGAATNRAAAGLMGVNPDRTAAAAWALGGGLAAVAGVLLADVTTLDPFALPLQMLPAFVAALIGGFESLVGAVVGAVVVGFVFGVVPLLSDLPVVGGVFVQSGSPQLALTVLALIVMALRGQRIVGVDEGGSGLTGGLMNRRRHDPGRTAALVVLGLALLVLWPFVAPFSMLGSSLLAIEFALAAMSLVVLTGWVGQISLAQATFVGLGAFVTAIVARDVGVGFPLSVLVGIAVAGVVAIGLGAVALRVRGLYLAVATLIFAWMGQAFLFRSAWMGIEAGSSTIEAERLGLPSAYPSFDLASRRVIYLIMLAVVVLAVAAMANLRDTRTGRAFFAVRGSEMAAASLGIDVTRVKLVAFGIAGVLAGTSGALLMYEQRSIVPDQFFVTASLQILAIAVVGGLTSLGGALVAGIVFASLNELFFQVEQLGGLLDLVSALLLVVVLLLAPGGLASLPEAMRVRFRDRRARRSATTVALATADVDEVSQAGEAPTDDVADTQVIRVSDGEDADDGADLAATVRLRQRAAASAPVRVVGRVGTAVRASGRRVVTPFAAARQRRRALKGVPNRPDDWVAEGKKRADDIEHGVPVTDSEEAVRRGAAGPLAAVLEAGVTRELPEDRSARRPLVQALDITVQFGGLRAVDDATLEVREGEIVGLIGPNGAGKTTLFNAILGLNDPRDGVVRLYGNEVSHLRPHLRARLGVARTFQKIQLFEQLSVFDNLLVATHLHNDAGLVSNLFAGPGTLAAEQRSRQRVHDVLQLLGLDDVADESVQNLPFGVLRMVELGRALVTGAKILMLDEAASGLDDTETAWLVEIVRRVRSLGVSVLLIEHDVPMVCGVADFVYVLDQGKIIAADTPGAIQRDPDVIAAYIGGADEDATPDDDAAATDEPDDDDEDKPPADGASSSSGRVRRRVIRRGERDEEDIVAGAEANPNGSPERDPAGRKAR